MIREIQNYWNRLEKKRTKSVAEKFQLSLSTTKRYVEMSESEINSLDSPRNYKKRESPMNDWLNVIFKMMDDKHSSETIYFYITRQSSFCGNKRNLESYIYLIGKNNFPNQFHWKYLMEVSFLQMSSL